MSGARSSSRVISATTIQSGGSCTKYRTLTAEATNTLSANPSRAAPRATDAANAPRWWAAQRLAAGAPVRSPADVHAHFLPRLRHAAQERFFAVLLDGRHRVIRHALVSQVTLTASLVHPREVFRPALERAAAAIVLVHNHPSGDPSPSGEDRRVTKRLRGAGELLGIRVVDHVVVAEGGFFSFQEAGEFSLALESGEGES